MERMVSKTAEGIFPWYHSRLVVEEQFKKSDLWPLLQQPFGDFSLSPRQTCSEITQECSEQPHIPARLSAEDSAEQGRVTEAETAMDRILRAYREGGADSPSRKLKRLWQDKQTVVIHFLGET